jgi:hypothetical protein
VKILWPGSKWWTEIESAISTFQSFPYTYDAVEVDKTNTILTDFTRRIFKK